MCPAFVVYLLTSLAYAKEQYCETGWFKYPSCLYQAHCDDTHWSCDDEVDPKVDLICAKGWFGPQCQYVDAVSKSQSTKAFITSATEQNPSEIPSSDLTDGSGNKTCLTTQNPGYVQVIWKDLYHITWIRLYVSSYVERYPDDAIKVEILGMNRSIRQLTCKIVTRSQTVVDVYCKMDVPTRQVKIMVSVLGNLCAVHIGGGRNVALKQLTLQSSTWNYKGNDTTSDLAVDGNTMGYLGDNTCSSTSHGDVKPTWRLYFKSPMLIYQVVIHNRKDTQYHDRLRGFTLDLYRTNNDQLWTFVDKEDPSLHTYIIAVDVFQEPVSHVEIRGQFNKSVLALCEVEIFGDSWCAVGKYGRQCELSCNCPHENNTCHPGTGACLNWCTGDGCQANLQLVLLDLPLYIGVGVGGVVIVLIIIIVVCVRRHKKRVTLPHEYHMADRAEQYNRPYDSILQQGISRSRDNNDGYELPVNKKDEGIYDQIDTN